MIWRVGRKVGRTIYAQVGAEPSDDDRLVGMLDTLELAEEAVNARNVLAILGAEATRDLWATGVLSPDSPEDFRRRARLTILLNTNSKMSRHKAAAQAVHAALFAFGIDHGAVIVLGAGPAEIEERCDVQIKDAGRTEIKPGTLTAGVVRVEES